MKFRIYYEVNGHKDSFTIEGDTVEEIREYVNIELENRNASPIYSEEI